MRAIHATIRHAVLMVAVSTPFCISTAFAETPVPPPPPAPNSSAKPEPPESLLPGSSTTVGVGYGAIAGAGQPSGLVYGIYSHWALSKRLGIPVLLAIGDGEAVPQAGSAALPVAYGAYMGGLRVRHSATGPYMDAMLGYGRSTKRSVDTGASFAAGGNVGWNIALLKLSETFGYLGITPNLSFVFPVKADAPVFMAMVGLSVIMPDRRDWQAPPTP